MRWQEKRLHGSAPDCRLNNKTLGRFFEEKKMEDFPIWLKLVIWGTIGLTVGYTIWGMISSMGQP